MNRLDIASKEISSLKEMDKLFEEYCEKVGITLDMTKSKEYNAYIDERTGEAFVWFIRAVFFVLNSNKETYGKV